MFNGRLFKTYGAILSLLAAATLAISISNIVLTSQAYCDPWMDDEPVHCSNINEPYVWTWVASGIWASAPIFIAGLFAISLSNNPARWTRMFTLFMYLSAIVFAPAMIILSAIEVWRGSASKWNFYSLGSELMEGNLLVEDSPYKAKFALPLVVTILGGIMFIMTGIITLAICCCMNCLGINSPSEPLVQQIYTPTPSLISTSKEVYCPPRADTKTPVDYQSSTGPYLATRYNSVLDPNNPGVMFGNFPSRGLSSGGSVKSNESNSEFRYK